MRTHGIDVSEWAIANREHPNVLLAGVEKLPFPDGHFDLVYSVHSLEHIPGSLKDAAFDEMARVGGRAVQFHMLPIIGLGPYVGDRDAVIAGLKRDPTHSLLNDRSWWLDEFQRVGLHDLNVGLHFKSESGPPDLGESQILVGGRRPIPVC